jgi:hypothetical protein
MDWQMKQVGIDKKQVVIDHKKGIVEVDGKRVPRLLLGIIRGGVGKCFVVKHYKGRKKGRKIVVTKYPDMSGIVASEKQRERRDLFREAVVYAKWVISDEERKKAFRKTLPRKRRKHVYQAAIRLYMSMQGDAGWLRKQLAVKSMLRSGEKEMIGVRAMVRSGQVEWTGKVMLNVPTEGVLAKNSVWERMGQCRRTMKLINGNREKVEPEIDRKGVLFRRDILYKINKNDSFNEQLVDEM